MISKKLYPKTKVLHDFILQNPDKRSRSDLLDRFKSLDQHLYILRQLGLIQSISSPIGTVYQPLQSEG